MKYWAGIFGRDNMVKAYAVPEIYMVSCFQETHEMLGYDFWKDSNVGYEKFTEYGTSLSDDAVDAMMAIDDMMWWNDQLRVRCYLAGCFKETYEILRERFWRDDE